MWLIDVQSYKLKYFQDVSQVDCKYAILSHRWEDDEVSHSDMTSRWDRLRLRRMKGWYKIQKCCEQAAKEGLPFAWVDTCCIDKTSSAELQEAINSMFRWYADAKACYVFMSDVKMATPEESQDASAESRTLSAFKKSQWFSRGWTLQELLAPKDLTFYDREWYSLGTRSQRRSIVREITGIPEPFLIGFNPEWTLNTDVCIAEVMIWASGRKTTRIEDKAYSLLGIFGVSMPMLYGEGTRAFSRLQEQLLSTRDDQTIFAWTGLGSPHPLSLALTDTPDDFVRLPPGYRWLAPTELDRRPPPVVSSEGIGIELLMQCVSPGVYHAIIEAVIYKADLGGTSTTQQMDATEGGTAISMKLAIPMREITSSNRFVRMASEKLGSLITYPASECKHFRYRSITLASYLKRKEHKEAMQEDSFSFSISDAVLNLWTFSQVSSAIEAPQTWPWKPSDSWVFGGEKSSAMIGLLTWNGWPHELIYSILRPPVSSLAFGFDFDCNPTVVVVIGTITYDELGSKQLHLVFDEIVDQLATNEIDMFGTKTSVTGGVCAVVEPNKQHHLWETYQHEREIRHPTLIVFKTTSITRWSGKGFRAVVSLENGMYDHYYKATMHINVFRESKQVPWELDVNIKRQNAKIISHAVAPKLTRFVQPQPAYRLGTWAEHGGEPSGEASTTTSSTNLG